MTSDRHKHQRSIRTMRVTRDEPWGRWVCGMGRTCKQDPIPDTYEARKVLAAPRARLGLPVDGPPLCPTCRALMYRCK